jgi:hypothetical protein
VLQGRFDVAKLQALAEKVQKDGLLKIDIEKYGDSKVYRISGKGFPGPLYAAVLDKTHVGAASNKNTIEDALDKAAGKKKTALKIKALAEMFAKFKGDESLAVLATADAIIGGAKGKLNPDGTQEIEGALRDQGVEALQVTVNVGDAIKGRTTLTVKDAATAAKIEEGIKGGIKQGITELEKMKEYPALLKALKTVKVAVKDQTVTMEGEGDGEAVQQFFVALLVPRTKVKPGPSTNPTKP